ncbi:uncharacterized protein J3D65DRAFT_421557 [Phyllosticta citribraziliensis]|uniref:Uncharacterized protein n=1 Tax=Phyllosticta citribraziliensis TaxID=989973 RepID=A0ABR1LJB8_9PEZI
MRHSRQNSRPPAPSSAADTLRSSSLCEGPEREKERTPPVFNPPPHSPKPASLPPASPFRTPHGRSCSALVKSSAALSSDYQAGARDRAGSLRRPSRQSPPLRPPGRYNTARATPLQAQSPDQSDLTCVFLSQPSALRPSPPTNVFDSAYVSDVSAKIRLQQPLLRSNCPSAAGSNFHHPSSGPRGTRALRHCPDFSSSTQRHHRLALNQSAFSPKPLVFAN